MEEYTRTLINVPEEAVVDAQQKSLYASCDRLILTIEGTTSDPDVATLFLWDPIGREWHPPIRAGFLACSELLRHLLAAVPVGDNPRVRIYDMSTGMVIKTIRMED